jgi:hypothetical protein
MKSSWWPHLRIAASVGIETRLQTEEPRDRKSIPGTDKRCLSSPQRPDVDSYSTGTEDVSRDDKVAGA